MKILKKISKVIGILLVIIVLAIVVLLVLDSNKTSYLKTDHHPGFENNDYLILNANVVPMSKDTVLMNKSVLIKNGKIERIDDRIEVDGIKTIDAKNKFLSPGLIDMHVHVWDRQELGLYLANGVTAIRDLWGLPWHLRLKKQINDQELIGPQFFVSSPKLTGENDQGDDKVQVGSVEEGKKLVIEYKDRGYDFIKTYAGIPEDIMNGIIEQSQETGISIAIHPSREILYLEQFHSQIASVEHAEEIIQQPLKYQLDSTKLEPIINRFTNSNTSFTPTLTGYYKIYEMLQKEQEILSTQQINYMNPLIQKTDSEGQLNRWINEKKNNPSITNSILQQHLFHLMIIKKMNDAGVNIICGTDAGIGITVPGYSIHEELKFYKEAGLTNFEVLKTATINASKTHKEFENMGSIEIGKSANLILTENNPLTDLETLGRPNWVMLNGHKIEKEILNTYVEKAYDRSNLVATALKYVEYLYVEK